MLGIDAICRAVFSNPPAVSLLAAASGILQERRVGCMRFQEEEEEGKKHPCAVCLIEKRKYDGRNIYDVLGKNLASKAAPNTSYSELSFLFTPAGEGNVGF